MRSESEELECGEMDFSIDESVTEGLFFTSNSPHSSVDGSRHVDTDHGPSGKRHGHKSAKDRAEKSGKTSFGHASGQVVGEGPDDFTTESLQILRAQLEQVGQLRRQAQDRDVEVRDLERKVEYMDKVNRGLVEELQASRREVEKIEVVAEEEAKARREAEAVYVELDKVKHELKHANSRIQEMERQRTRTVKENELALHARHEYEQETMAQISSYRQEAASLRSRNDKLVDEVSLLKRKSQEYQDKVQQLEHINTIRVKELTYQMEQLKMEKMDAIEFNRALSKELDARQDAEIFAKEAATKRSKAEALIETLKKQIEDLTTSREHMREKCRHEEEKRLAEEKIRALAEERARILQEQLDAVMKGNTALHIKQKDVEHLRQDIRLANETADKLKNEKEIMKREMSKLQEEHDRLVSQVNDWNKAIQVLHYRITLCCSQARGKTNEQSIPDSSLVNLIEKKKYLEPVKTLFGSLDALERIYGTQAQRVSEAEENLSAFQNTVRKKEEDTIRMQTQIDQLRNENDQLKETIRRYASEVKHLNMNLDESQHAIFAMDKEIVHERDVHQRLLHKVKRQLICAYMEYGGLYDRSASLGDGIDLDDTLDQIADHIVQLLRLKHEQLKNAQTAANSSSKINASVSRKQQLLGTSVASEASSNRMESIWRECCFLLAHAFVGSRDMNVTLANHKALLWKVLMCEFDGKCRLLRWAQTKANALLGDADAPPSNRRFASFRSIVYVVLTIIRLSKMSRQSSSSHAMKVPLREGNLHIRLRSMTELDSMALKKAQVAANLQLYFNTHTMETDPNAMTQIIDILQSGGIAPMYRAKRDPANLHVDMKDLGTVAQFRSTIERLCSHVSSRNRNIPPSQPIISTTAMNSEINKQTGKEEKDSFLAASRLGFSINTNHSIYAAPKVANPQPPSLELRAQLESLREEQAKAEQELEFALRDYSM